MARKTKEQAQETRQDIINAAVHLFSERGVAATSLSDIATVAGVTRGAIYWHFKNKFDLFNEIWQVADARITAFESEYQTKYPSDPLYVLTETLIYILNSTVSDRNWRALMEIVYHKCEYVGEMALFANVRKTLYGDCYSRIEETLNKCISFNQLPANLHCRRAAIVIRGYISGMMENWLFLPDTYDLEKESRALVMTLVDTLNLSPNLRNEHT